MDNPHITGPFTKGVTFLKEFVALSQDLHVQLCIDEDLDGEVRNVIWRLFKYLERWLSLELKMSASLVYMLLSYASSPAVNLMRLHINLIDPFKRPHDQALMDILSVSPLDDVRFEYFPYSYMPIKMSELCSFHIHSYDPTELHSIFRGAQHLEEFIITPSLPPYGFRTNPLDKYVYTSHTSLKWLSLVMNIESGYGTYSKIPIAFDHISLLGLQRFEMLTGGQDHDQMDLEPIEYLHLFDLFRRLQNSEGPFKVLHCDQGMVQDLKELCITETLDIVGSYGNCDSRLEMLEVSLNLSSSNHIRMDTPAPGSSPFQRLIRIKERGMDVRLLLNGRDFLKDEQDHAIFSNDCEECIKYDTCQNRARIVSLSAMFALCKMRFLMMSIVGDSILKGEINHE
ncbi:hypothetical protein EDD18DRAFT_1112472 [Armillaria luteobubalina]|uniref:Uncharacterized protein n=1 Tax=Armillaria luteobubalina TaxID=153913 RepID=A0AA39PER4_9AGAR|nr:hypothetical protein EDD18DRAFT_1112472 [Armillaria luteobubalina]